MGYSMRDPYAIPMMMLVKPMLWACLAVLATTSALAAPPRPDHWQDGGQGAARERQQSGRNLPAREIERRVIPTVPGAQYLGFDFDPLSDIYTLKFLRNGSVIWVDVDGRTGRIVRRTGK